LSIRRINGTGGASGSPRDALAPPAEVLTDAEVRELLTVLYRTGLRIQEALNLKSADIASACGTIRVLHGKSDRAGTVGRTTAVVQLWLA
jgi:site-specific recombinase XerD